MAETCIETIAPTEVPITEALPTEIPITEPPSLDISTGSYLMSYTDENTGDYMDYYLFIPNNAVANMPLIIFLHGDGEIGRPHVLEDYGIRTQVEAFYGEDHPFIHVSPCTHAHGWTSERVAGTLKGLIDHLIEEYQIDPDRIIITGHSLGAIGVWYMISTYGDYFAGAVPISCGCDLPLNYENCSKVSVLGIVGNSDMLERNYNKAMRKIIDKINESGGKGELLEIDGASHEYTSRESFSREIFDWMLEQKRGE